MSEESKDMAVVGTNKEAEEIRFEELWMKRIEILENQYDQHVTKIQRRLFDEKFDKRVLETLRAKNAKLVDQVQELTHRSDGLEKNVEALQSNLRKKESKERILKEKLEDTLAEATDNKLKLKSTERQAKEATRQKVLIERQDSVLRTQQEKLSSDLRDSEVEISGIKQQFQIVGKQSQSLVQALRKAEEEKRRASKEAEAIEGSVSYLLRERENDEECILRLKNELRDVVKQLHVEKQKFSEKERQQMLHEKNLQCMRDELQNVLCKVASAALETRYWKQEAEALLKVAEAPPSHPKTKLHAKQKERCKDAELNHRINILERRIKVMEEDKAALTNQMKTLASLHRSLMHIHQKNLTRRKSFEEKTGFRRPCKRHENDFQLHGSKAELEKKEKKIQALEKEMFRSKRAYNYLKFRLQEKPELEKNLRQVEKTLFQVEHEKQDLDLVSRVAAKKLGQAPVSDWTSLKQGFVEQIKAIQTLREKLPPLMPREGRKYDEVKMHGEDMNEKLSSLRKELTALERKQAVFQNIKAEKERLAEEKRIREAEEKEQEEEELCEDSSEIPDSPSSESDHSLIFSGLDSPDEEPESALPEVTEEAIKGEALVETSAPEAAAAVEAEAKVVN